MKTKLITAALVLAFAVIGVSFAAELDRTVLPIPEPVFRGQIGLTPADSKKDFPQQVEAPKGAPNIVIIMPDDVGLRPRKSSVGRFPCRL